MNSKISFRLISHPSKISTIFKNFSKFILFDTDALVSILEYESNNLLDELANAKIEFRFIDPVQRELLNTNSEKARNKRNTLFAEYDFQQIPMLKNDFAYSARVQSWLASRSCFPSVTDIYLAGVLARYSQKQKGNIFLFTSNVCDFLSPLFEREGYIIFQNQRSMKTASFLSINHSLLPEL